MTNIKNISIKDFLAEKGILPSRETARDGMYLSPLREERTPSLHVDYNKNLWYDFGADCGGSIIDLVMRLEGCNFSEACTKLEKGNFSFHRIEPLQSVHSTLQINEVKPLQDIRLLNYIRSRAIDLEVAKHYCREVHYSVNSKQFFAIGFGSDSGGWELRNEYFKGGAIPKDATTFNNGSDTCLLFEGFMDMLSYLTLKKSIVPQLNISVLNSVANLKKAEVFLKTHRTIHCFLDNDEAGKRALAQVEKLGIEVVDQSNLYRNHKDLNEYTMSQAQKQNQVRVQKPISTPRRKFKL